MSIVRGMPCSVTAAGDQFDNEPKKWLIDEVAEEEKSIAIIQEALLQGDRFQICGSRYISDFSSVVDDNLCCNTEFANALRKLMVGNTAEGVEAIRKVVNAETLSIAESIYLDQEG